MRNRKSKRCLRFCCHSHILLIHKRIHSSQCLSFGNSILMMIIIIIAMNAGVTSHIDVNVNWSIASGMLYNVHRMIQVVIGWWIKMIKSSKQGTLFGLVFNYYLIMCESLSSVHVSFFGYIRFFLERVEVKRQNKKHFNKIIKFSINFICCNVEWVAKCVRWVSNVCVCVCVEWVALWIMR